MMKKILTIIALTLSFVGATAQTNHYDYTKIEQDGIYYFLDDKNSQAYVCSKHDYPKNFWVSDFEGKEPTYTGDIKIPDVIKYDTKEYCVVGLIPFAFYNCEGLETLTLPNSITFINDYALKGCGNIKMNIPENISFLGNYAFKDTKITNNQSTLNLPAASIIDDYALDGTSFNNVIFGSGMKLFASYILKNSNIESIELQGAPNDIALQMNVRAFYDFKGREIRMPNKTIKVTYEMISNCPNLERVVFSPLTELNHIQDFQYFTINTEYRRYSEVNDLIYKCPNMKEVVCYATTPPQFYWHNYPYTDFCIIDKPDCVLKVPFGSEELYRADPVWGKFQIITGFEPDEYTSVSSPYAITDNSDAPVEYFNLQGMKVTNPSQGNIYIRKQGSQVKKVVF